MIPIRDDNPHFLTPVVTYGIIGLNLAAWVLLQGMGTEPSLSSSVCSLGAVPGELMQTVAAGTSYSVAMETSTDMQTWVPCAPGDYASTGSPRFFRVKVSVTPAP